MTDHATIGRAAREKGIRAELQLAKYLRTWWPGAERSVVTGFRAGDHVSADHGDIRNTPGIVWQCKYLGTMSDRQIDTALEEAQNQAFAAHADYGILIQRRQGKADPGNWWAWMHVVDFVGLATMWNYNYPFDGYRVMPVRVLLRDLMSLLERGGYTEVKQWMRSADTAGQACAARKSPQNTAGAPNGPTGPA